jgi:hypothetical protein
MKKQTDLTSEEITLLKKIVYSDCSLTPSPLAASPEKIAAARKKGLHPHFGGYPQDIADQLKRVDPELLHKGWEHRRMICKLKVNAREITMLRISSIPAEASWRDCVRGLCLQDLFHLDVLPDFENRGKNRGVALLYLVDRQVAEQLVQQSGAFQILGKLVIIELDGANPR